MSKKKIVIITVITAVAIVAALLYCAAPSYLYKKTIEKSRKAAGLTVKSVNVQDFKIVYSEGGKGETVLLLHGFGANRDNWNNFARSLTSRYHVIIPDLPGFGDSTKKADAMYNIMTQVVRLNQFAKQLKLKKFHIAGNSMGGNISGTFAATYPEMVKSLTLIDASGVKSPVKSDRQILTEKGTNPLIVKDVKDFDRMLEYNFVNPPKLPSFMKKYLAKKSIESSKLNEQISIELGKTDYLALEKNLYKIKAPTLIIWGDSDRVVHISSMPIFEKGIKGSRSVIIKGAGHLPMMEKPVETSKVYIDFIEKIK